MLFINKRIFCVSCFFWFLLTFKMWELFLPHPVLHLITLNHKHTHTHTFGRISLDQVSACRRVLYLTTHNTHNRQTSTPPAKFEPSIPASERPQAHALDRETTGIGLPWLSRTNNFWCVSRLKRFTPNRYAVSILVFSSLAQGFQYGVADYSSETVHHWNESAWPLTRSGIKLIGTLVTIIILIIILNFIQKIRCSCS